MRCLFYILASLIVLMPITLAEGVTAPSNQLQPPSSELVPKNISFEDCMRMFNIEKERLFYLAIGSITANKFSIDEIQTENGYIIFTAARQKYLATVAGIDNSNSILKISPCNNIYYFQPNIITGIFNYIDSNKNSGIK